jgi:hypothetical protein
MPRLAKTKKKPSEKEASGDGDGFEAILSVGVGKSTSLNMQRKSPMTVRTKSKVAGSKKNTSKGATSTSEELPSPESGGRKCPPEQLVTLVWNILATKPILTPSKVILTMPFGCPFQETATQGISF